MFPYPEMYKPHKERLSIWSTSCFLPFLIHSWTMTWILMTEYCGHTGTFPAIGWQQAAKLSLRANLQGAYPLTIMIPRGFFSCLCLCMCVYVCSRQKECEGYKVYACICVFIWLSVYLCESVCLNVHVCVWMDMSV